MSMHIGTAPLIVVFENASGGGEIDSYLWDFGDGEQSDLLHPTHTFITAGTYTVVLTATGPGGSASHTEIVVVEWPPPSVYFEDSSGGSGDSPLVVDFYNESTGEITSYNWIFGDGFTSSEESPRHTFQSAGTFTVTLTCTGPGGLNSYSRTITVIEPPPKAYFVPSAWEGSIPLVVDFNNLTTGLVTGYVWNFGDGTATSTEEHPQHTFTNVGSYSVTLTATGPGGTNTMTQVLNPTNPPPPVADFDFGHYDSGLFHSGSPENIPPQDVIFNNKTTGNVASYLWNFGDGTATSTSEDPTHTYTAAGTYTVTLTATGIGGSHTKTKTVVITYPAPNANFTNAFSKSLVDGVYESPVTFSPTNTSTGDITSYFWDFGNGTTSTTENVPGVSYNSAGVYNASLRVTGPGGSSYHSTSFEVIKSEALPVPDFEIRTEKSGNYWSRETRAWKDDQGNRTQMTGPGIGAATHYPAPDQRIANASIDGATFTVYPGVPNISFTIRNTTQNTESDWTWQWALVGAGGTAVRRTTTAKLSKESLTYYATKGQSKQYSISLTATNGTGSATKTVHFNIFRQSTPSWQWWFHLMSGPMIGRKPSSSLLKSESVNRQLDSIWGISETGPYQEKKPFSVFNTEAGLPARCREKCAAVWCLNNPPKWLVDALKNRGGSDFKKLRVTYMTPSGSDTSSNWDALSTGVGTKLLEYGGSWHLNTLQGATRYTLSPKMEHTTHLSQRLGFLHQMKGDSGFSDSDYNNMTMPANPSVVVVEPMTIAVANFGVKIWLKESSSEPYGSSYNRSKEKDFKQVYTHFNYHAKKCKGMDPPKASFEIIKSSGMGEHWHITLKNNIRDGDGNLIRESDEALGNVGGWRWVFSDNNTKPDQTSRFASAHANKAISPVSHIKYPNKSGLKYTNGAGYTNVQKGPQSMGMTPFPSSHRYVDHEHSMEHSIKMRHWENRELPGGGHSLCGNTRRSYTDSIEMPALKNPYKTGIANGTIVDRGGEYKYWVTLEVWGVGGKANDSGNSKYSVRWRSSTGTASPYSSSTTPPARSLEPQDKEVVWAMNKSRYYWRSDDPYDIGNPSCWSQ